MFSGRPTPPVAGALVLTCLVALAGPGCGQHQPDPAPAVDPALAPLAAAAAENPELAGTLRMIAAHAPLQAEDVADPNSAPNRHLLTELLAKAVLAPNRAPRPVPAPPPPASALVGTLEGKFSLNNRGTGKYLITLPVPESRLGPQPYLTVAYLSNLGDGILGRRFSLGTGFESSIQRGRSLLAREGEARSAEFGPADHFYLDGKRLICITPPATAGRPGSVYHTEVDSFVRIEALGEGDRITQFVLHDDRGRRLIFGGTGDDADAYQPGYDDARGALDDTAYEYALKRVIDRLGNELVCHYEHKGFGEWVLADLTYTGSPGVPPLFHVHLSYRAKHPPQSSYHGQRRTDQRHCLDEIRILAGTNPVPVNRYVFSYEPPGPDGAWQLAAVQGYLAANVGELSQALPPTRFVWSEGTPRVAAVALSHAPVSVDTDTGADAAAPITWSDTGDFDGDGRTDCVTYDGALHVALSTAIGFGASADTWFARADLQTHLGTGAAGQFFVGDVDGDNRDDVLVVAANGRLLDLRSSGHDFVNHGELVVPALAQLTGADPTAPAARAALSRVTTGDLDGDGRQDFLVQGANGDVSWFAARTDHFEAGPASIALVAPSPATTPVRHWAGDLNGDGLADYTWLETGATGARGEVRLRCALMLPDGRFGPPATLQTWPAADPAQVVILVGQFNQDDLPDFLCSQTPADDNSSATGWTVLINRGPTSAPGAAGAGAFARIAQPLPVTPAGAGTGSSLAPHPFAGTAGPGPDPSAAVGPVAPLPTAFTLGTDQHLMAVDINGDAIDDLVFIPGEADGWWSCTAVGDGTFAAARPLRDGIWSDAALGDPAILAALPRVEGDLARSRRLLVEPSADINGDGLPDWYFALTGVAPATARGALLSDATRHPEICGFPHLVTHVTNGYGQTLDLDYRAARDAANYVAGAPVRYPIRELRSATPVVTEVWHGAGAGQYSHFSYLYAGNRIDFSGRGSLGFAAFLTHDRATDFVKFQQVEHTFPLTGLDVRAQTYWLHRDAQNLFIHLIASTDHANVYDLVREAPGGRLLGTVFPFNSEERLTRWSLNQRATYTIPVAELSDMRADTIWIPAQVPARPVSHQTTRRWYDRQNRDLAPPTRFPRLGSAWGLTGILEPRALPPGVRATVPPGQIVHGNIVLLQEETMGGNYTRTFTTFQPPASTADTLTGLVAERHTVTRKGGAIEVSPTTRYRYFGATSTKVAEIEDRTQATASVDHGRTETTYERDERGRLLKQTVLEIPAAGTITTPPATQPDATAATGSPADKRPTNDATAPTLVYEASDYDPDLDLPRRESDEKYGARSVRHHPLFRASVAIDYDQGGRVRTDFDGLGRSIRVVNLDSDYRRETLWAWTADDAEGWRRTVRLHPPTPAGAALPGQSVYVERVSKAGQPTVTTYYDAQERAIRVTQETTNGRVTRTDTLFNELGYEAAKATDYTLGSAVEWTISHYDTFGNLDHTTKTTTHPNVAR